MGRIVMEKPQFNKDQVISASHAVKRFAEVRRNAKSKPQFISQNNNIDSVIQSYEDYEKMYMELESLRELFYDLQLSERIKKADLNPQHRFPIREVMGSDNYAEFQQIDPNSISDEELFE
ncbi:hypothetical protein CSV71_10325 [Sporosarcina sp. P21c]|uniref:hypothetical protein n=1 Tax=unclassified Sporosarcina TaxID=2647733 RepID=UPI000C17147F|nr:MULTISPECIES: hypothetical protein [unclassified Sporosarcina]PIC67642.1 hypothetical protein CSV78_06990 [Sporosarcina sp. P16a]PIC83561.1 hypothetical protein CSV73_06540 [Sporosarcina sp. P1]PIC89312.1 hypothetical protein CSV71_10325 [Sporosarcina sp. P21c]PIC93093.1 hypothetical protein CSV70_07740 [Sporosarcina sp. P25]